MWEGQGRCTSAERTLMDLRPALWFLRIFLKSLQEGLEASRVLCGEAGDQPEVGCGLVWEDFPVSTS